VSKILVVDIETSPNLVYTWGHWKQNISPKQVVTPSDTLSYAAKWLGEDEIFYGENRKGNDRKIISDICALLDEADMVIAHNGDRFDIPRIKARALVHGFKPISPFKAIDTLKIAKREFGFQANSLEYLLNILKCKVRKGGHKKFPGFVLWTECMKGNVEAWDEMREYNILDILSLEELYLKLRPWSTLHPNVAIYNEDQEQENPVCPKCGHTHMQYRGYSYTSVGKYHRLQCQGCHGWSRTRFTLAKTNKNHVVNAVN